MNDMTSGPRPSPARVVKTIAFALDEWAAIEQLQRVTEVREFTALCRMGLSELAKQHHIAYPTQAPRRQSA